jgi:radical SAM superfamily enzyme YgiQ (UPF0313 family)
MKILYLNPPYGENFVRSARWAAKSRGRVQRHPEQALIQVAVLEKAEHECKFIDGAAQNLTKKEILKIAKKFKPEICIIHTTTPSIYNDLSYAKSLKKIIKTKIVLVGAHASAVPANTFKLAKGSIDIIAKGEVDYTLREIAEKLKNKASLKDVKGISYKNKTGEIIHNKNRKLIKDLDKLPFPAWEHINPKWYHDGGKLYPFLTLYTGRGCFGLCTFCRETQVINGRKLRLRSPKKIIAEIKHDLKLFPDLREIMFETDTFTAVPSHVKKVCKAIIKNKLHKKISWSCNVRVDIDRKLLPLMKKAGCRMLMVGFEFGTNQQLKAVKKGTTIKQARRFTQKAHQLGFTIHGCFMIGAPKETEKSAQKTIDFAKSLPLDTIQISGIATYPGTDFYRWAQKRNYIVANNWKDWVDDNLEQKTLLNYPQMSKQKIDFYIDKGLKEFYLRPSQMLKMLFSIRSFDDVKRKFYGLKSFIDYFK